MVTSDLLSLNTREVDKRYLAINSLRGYLSVAYVPVCVTDNEQRDVIQSTGCWAMRVEMSRDRNCKLIIDVCLFVYLFDFNVVHEQLSITGYSNERYRLLSQLFVKNDK